MFNDPFHPEEAATQQHDSNKRMLLAIVCAVGLTAILLVAFGLIRKYYMQRVIANVTPPPKAQKEPPLAHVVIDEPTLERGSTTISGVVKNVSDRQLTGLA